MIYIDIVVDLNVLKNILSAFSLKEFLCLYIHTF